MNKSSLEIMTDLHRKFDDNFGKWTQLPDIRLEKTIIGLSSIAAIGEILRARKTSSHHDICCNIYDEIFIDGVSSVYLATNAMDKPACIVLRRTLELGIAAVYLWDMPHMAHSWRHHDEDLSFSEMVSHVNSKGYTTYVGEENKSETTIELLPQAKVKKMYGYLSDIVHGKMNSFESSLPDRFKLVEADWIHFVEMIEAVVSMLVRMYTIRYDLKNELFKKLPAARKEFS